MEAIAETLVSDAAPSTDDLTVMVVGPAAGDG